MAKLDIKEIEEKWKSYWKKEKIYSFDKKSKKKIYSIDTPPPTLSGEMHIGHACSYSQQDFIARFKRMSGFNVFYPFGSDDNGLPTERLVEKINNVRSKDLSRSNFIKLCLKTLKEITPKFVQDWKDLAISCDYDIYYSTIDKNSQKISQKSFLDLYKSDFVYKEKFPTIFCPDCQTPIAQAELEDKEKNTQFTTLRFSAEGKDLPIATTRPELLGACVSVFINPEDKRYKNLIGKEATVPLYNHKVPILADPSADPEKGTGVLMVCSYGDKYDVDAIKRHKLKPKVIFNEQGKLTDKKYSGLSIKEARSAILKDLKEANLILEQKQISHIVNTHDKCGTPIEFIPTEQWFIKILDNAKKLISQGKKVSWHPKFMFKRYENWIKGLEWDWSISRERHFGIPIPAWYCASCKKTVVAKESELPVDPSEVSKKCDTCKSPLEPETRVLDTWATSSLTPQIASSLVNNVVSLPYSLRPQAHDIIRTWAFYTIVKALYHESKIPWEDITISGFVTLKGEKMSKSKGNVIKPKIVMEEFGSDSLRYWAATTKLGEDIDYQEKDLVTGKKFITKLLNAANFVFMNLSYQKKAPKLIETDRLFLSQLNSLTESVTSAFNQYNYSKAKLETESFFWKTFADNYLEIVKHRVYNGNKEEKASAFYTLHTSLLTLTKLMAPFTPFITEEIYQTHFKKTEKDKSIHISNWPTQIKIESKKTDPKTWAKLIEVITVVRQEKSKAQKSMKAPVSLTIPKADQKTLASLLPDLKAVTSAESISTGPLKVSLI